MAKPRLSTKTPDDPVTNALIDFHGEILADPNTARIAIVEIITPESKRKNQTGEETATVQIVHLELMHGADAEAVEKIFTRAHFNRTGNKTRPAPGAAPAPLGTPLEGMGDLDDTVE